MYSWVGFPCWWWILTNNIMVTWRDIYRKKSKMSLMNLLVRSYTILMLTCAITVYTDIHYNRVCYHCKGLNRCATRILTKEGFMQSVVLPWSCPLTWGCFVYPVLSSMGVKRRRYKDIKMSVVSRCVHTSLLKTHVKSNILASEHFMPRLSVTTLEFLIFLIFVYIKQSIRFRHVECCDIPLSVSSCLLSVGYTLGNCFT